MQKYCYGIGNTKIQRGDVVGIHTTDNLILGILIDIHPNSLMVVTVETKRKIAIQHNHWHTNLLLPIDVVRIDEKTYYDKIVPIMHMDGIADVYFNYIEGQ